MPAHSNIPSGTPQIAAQYVLHVLMHPNLDPAETRLVCREFVRRGGIK